jgi:hypothetical protein
MTTSDHSQPAPAAPGVKAQREWKPGDPLEPPEQALLDHALAGTRLDLAGGGSVDHQAMNKWGPARTVRAAVLRHLLVGPEPSWPVHSKGVRLRGARISGRLDLESATVRCPLMLEDCYLDSPDPVTLNYATVSRIVLSRCRVAGGLTADLLVATKELELGGSLFEGVVRLVDADITGPLSCRGAKLTATNRDGNALVADGIRVGAGAFLDLGFNAAGGVWLVEAEITGQLSCRDAELAANRDGDALGGDRMKVGGNVWLDGKFTAAGAVWLNDADVTGQVVCRGKLTGADRDGDTLVGDRMKVGGGVLLDQGFTAAGAVRLADANITGPLGCRGAKLTGTNHDGDALVGARMRVGGDAFFDKGFIATGAVVLVGARIEGSLWLDGAELAGPVALPAAGVQVGGQLNWAPRSPVRGLVDLERASVYRLDDDWSLPDAHWPPAGQLRLAGFTYDGFGGLHRASWRQRLDWIRRSHTTATATAPAVFAGQPYEQLARVYRQMGHESQARHVAIARRNDVRRFGSLTRLQKLGNWLSDQTIRHGYQPLRAVGLLVAVYLLVLAGFWFAQHRDSVIVPAKDTKTVAPAPSALHCSPGYPCFYPAGYAVDVVVPIVNLRQAENWRPDGHAAWGWAYVAGGWIATGLGWAFTTLAVAGYTGLVRKD